MEREQAYNVVILSRPQWEEEPDGERWFWGGRSVVAIGSKQRTFPTFAEALEWVNGQSDDELRIRIVWEGME